MTGEVILIRCTRIHACRVSEGTVWSLSFDKFYDYSHGVREEKLTRHIGHFLAIDQSLLVAHSIPSGGIKAHFARAFTNVHNYCEKT